MLLPSTLRAPMLGLAESSAGLFNPSSAWVIITARVMVAVAQLLSRCKSFGNRRLVTYHYSKSEAYVKMLEFGDSLRVFGLYYAKLVPSPIYVPPASHQVFGPAFEAAPLLREEVLLQ
jgi:hypothetical protein